MKYVRFPWLALGIGLGLLIGGVVLADDRKKPGAYAEAEAHAIAKNEAHGGDASADNAVTVGGDHNESSNTNVVLVPNNNTEHCLRVWGISFGNGNGGGGIGVPYRSKKCDYEQAADDAFAAGERSLGWWWKCQNPSLHKRWRIKGEEDQYLAADRCHAFMMRSASTSTDERQQVIIDQLHQQSAEIEELRRQLDVTQPEYAK